MKEDGHNYTFQVGEMPWKDGTRKEIESKPYLERVRELLLYIMSVRHDPTSVWESASEALRVIDTEEKDGKV